jgi:isochorismate pyruvate lyase
MADRSSDPTHRPMPKPPGACADMRDLRVEIDRLDGQIVALLAERARYVARAAEIKRDRAAIVDEARIRQVISGARSQAAELGTDPDLVEAIYRAMIDAFIRFEERAFDKKG